jgi:CheY-like chemotaxis protein/anti-sigma regulatory factor (Ser/Thr protein kinase)
MAVMANLAVLQERLCESPPEEPARMRAIVDDTLDCALRIERVVRDLVTFSRDRPEKLGLVSLEHVVLTARRLVDHQLRLRARVELDLAPVPPVVADENRLVQVVTNLLVNAAQAIEEGQAARNWIRIHLRRLEGAVLLVVEDTGCGVPADIRERIFEPFFTTKGDEGTGLGLALSAEIVRQHRGEIRLSCPPGGGTRFEVRMPVGPAVVAAAPCLSVAARLPPPAPHARARVLAIDDEPRLLRVYDRALRGHHDVVLALGGAEGLAILERDSAFAAVICDLMMPDVDGPTYASLEATTAPDVDGPMFHEVLCARYPHLRRRVAFCTGGAITGRTRRFLDQTEALVLQKPMLPADLRAAVGRILDAAGDVRQAAPAG